MTIFTSPSGRWHLPEQPQSRLIVGIVISVLIHGLILSLQIGIPGVSLPSLLAPWTDRRAPELSIRLANVGVPPSLPQPSEDAAAVEPAPAVSSNPVDASPAPDIAPTPPAATWHPSLLPSPVKSEPSLEKPSASVENPISPTLLLPSKKESHQKILTREEAKPSTFMVPEQETGEAGPPTTSTTDTPSPALEVVEKSAPDIAPAVTETGPSLKEQAAQKLAEEESRRQALALEKKTQAEAVARQLAADTKAKQAAEEVAQQKAIEQAQKQEAQKLKEDAARQTQMISSKKLEDEKKQEQARAEDLLRKQAATFELQKQAAIKLAHEESVKEATKETAKREQEIEIKKNAEEKKQAAEKAERLAIERDAEKKAEEALRKQAEITARKKLSEELAVKQKEQELARQREQELVEHQKAEVAAAKLKEQLKEQQKEQERQATATAAAAATTAANAAAAANAAQKGGDKNGGNTVSPGSLSGHDLISRALSQARKVDQSDDFPVRHSSSLGMEDMRRRTFFEGFDKDVGMKMYIESWRQKIERNGNLNYAQSSREKASGDLIVTVAVRSDGSVDNVNVVRSSGRADLIDAVRRIVRLNARYSAFPPNLARQYEMVEIRRIWSFDDGLKLLEEVH